MIAVATKHESILRLPEMSMSQPAVLDFTLPPELEAHEPPEARGLARDEVRLMASWHMTDKVIHTRFRDLPRLLDPGDVLVINTSATIPASLPTTHADGMILRLHLSTRLPGDLWIVELRRPDAIATQPFRDVVAGESFALPAGGIATTHTPYAIDRSTLRGDSHRLWIATLDLPEPLELYLQRHGRPIRYGYVAQDWPLEAYQTVYATEPGSAEMPSAGRGFTPELLTRLIAKGVQIAPLVLHTGVASLEDHEPPYEEWYRVPADTARIVNSARGAQRRIIAVGTTAVRALETVTDDRGTTHGGEGWTRLIITPERGIRAVTGLLTGLHEPRATHLAMLEALTGRRHLEMTYAEALRERYLWHEFGDLHLILP